MSWSMTLKGSEEHGEMAGIESDSESGEVLGLISTQEL